MAFGFDDKSAMRIHVFERGIYRVTIFLVVKQVKRCSVCDLDVILVVVHIELRVLSGQRKQRVSVLSKFGCYSEPHLPRIRHDRCRLKIRFPRVCKHFFKSGDSQLQLLDLDVSISAARGKHDGSLKQYAVLRAVSELPFERGHYLHNAHTLFRRVLLCHLGKSGINSLGQCEQTLCRRAVLYIQNVPEQRCKILRKNRHALS